MLGQRRSRWPNIKPSQSFLFYREVMSFQLLHRPYIDNTIIVVRFFCIFIFSQWSLAGQIVTLAERAPGSKGCIVTVHGPEISKTGGRGGAGQGMSSLSASILSAPPGKYVPSEHYQYVCLFAEPASFH